MPRAASIMGACLPTPALLAARGIAVTVALPRLLCVFSNGFLGKERLLVVLSCEKPKQTQIITFNYSTLKLVLKSPKGSVQFVQLQLQLQLQNRNTNTFALQLSDSLYSLSATAFQSSKYFSNCAISRSAEFLLGVKSTRRPDADGILGTSSSHTQCKSLAS